MIKKENCKEENLKKKYIKYEMNLNSLILS